MLYKPSNSAGWRPHCLSAGNRVRYHQQVVFIGVNFWSQHGRTTWFDEFGNKCCLFSLLVVHLLILIATKCCLCWRPPSNYKMGLLSCSNVSPTACLRASQSRHSGMWGPLVYAAQNLIKGFFAPSIPPGLYSRTGRRGGGASNSLDF
jgi:hypothetical protein